MNRSTTYLFTSLLFLLVIACGSPSQTTTQQSTSNPTKPPTAAPTSTTVPTAVPEATAIPGIGQAVVVDGIQWKVIEAKDYGNRLTRDKNGVKNYADAKTEGKFIWIRYEIKALEGGGSWMKDHIQLVDDAGKIYAGHDKAEDLTRMQLIRWLPEEEWCPRSETGFSVMQKQLKQGESYVCQEVFDIPAEATGLKVRVSNLAIISKQYAFINLNF